MKAGTTFRVVFHSIDLAEGLPGTEREGDITVYAIDPNIDDLFDILMLCELNTLNVLNLCDFSSSQLQNIGQRIANCSSIHTFEVTGDITVPVASMVRTVISETESIRRIDFSTCTTIGRGGDRPAERAKIFQFICDGFSNNSSTVRTVKLRACRILLIVTATFKGLAANTNIPSVETIDFSKSRCSIDK